MRRARPKATPTPKPTDPFRSLDAAAAAEAEAEEAEAYRRRVRRSRTILPLFLAGAAVITVGAAAYSRSALSSDGAASTTAVATALEPSDESLRARSRDSWLREAAAAAGVAVGPSAAPVAGSLVKDAAGNYPGVQVEIGRVNITRDATGISQTSLPLRVTNIGYAPRSFDIRVTARDAGGIRITDDTGTVLDLRPGQSAEVRVLDIVNDAIAAQLQQATFDITDVFAY